MAYSETIASVSETNPVTDQRHFIFEVYYSLFVLNLPVFSSVSFPVKGEVEKGDSSSRYGKAGR